MQTLKRKLVLAASVVVLLALVVGAGSLMLREPAAPPAVNTAGLPIPEHYEITAADSGKTFSYTLTARLGVVLDETSYPQAQLTLSCDPAAVLGPISNIPSVAKPLWAVRYEAVVPGRCTLADRDFSVTLLVLPPQNGESAQ